MAGCEDSASGSTDRTKLLTHEKILSIMAFFSLLSSPPYISSVEGLSLLEMATPTIQQPPST